MPPDDRNKLNRIEELKSKLFSNSYLTKISSREGFSRTDMKKVPDSWGDENKVESNMTHKFFMKTSIFKNFFIGSLIFLVLAIGYGAYEYFVGGNTVSNNNIDISVLGNNFTAGGDDLSLVVGITNKNSTALDLVDLVLEYPKNASSDTSSTDPSADLAHFRESLGTIPAGAVRNENVKITLFGEQGVVVPIKVSIEYRVEGSNAIFVKDTTHDVTISSTPLNLSVDAPDNATPGQDITINVKATLNATKPVSNVALRVDYPVGFQFTSAKPAPTVGNNVWSFGDLAPGSEHDIAIVGKMVGVFDGDAKTFRVTSGSQSATDKSVIDVVFNSLSHVVNIQKPFIGTQFYVNGVYQDSYAVSDNGSIHGEIHWTNNLDTAVDDFVIKAKITGDALDKRTINAQQGFYDSNSNTITWDKNSQTGFSELSPGDSGVVMFEMSPLPLYSATSGLVVDPSINVDISVTGKQSLAGYATQDLNNFESKTVKIISDLGFNAKALYYSGAFKNTGAIPPKVGAQTTYTIVWTLSNSANSISKAVVTATLPSWIDFSGDNISPSSET